jgi:hypothetical protein
MTTNMRLSPACDDQQSTTLRLIDAHLADAIRSIQAEGQEGAATDTPQQGCEQDHRCC